MAIKRLPVQLANQIAAGEVVERPSSVVKELIENSLDAGAQSIEIDIEKGGHKRIRIKDDGSGIEKKDLILALAPHSTSKIATLDDLENIASLGFRGEALASISSVSRLTLTSKPAAQSEAWAASAQGREMEVEILPAAHPNGTTIEVNDLFYNTPARRKFLRAEKTEFQHIEDIVKRIALSRSRTSFLLKHNGKVLKRWTAAKTACESNRITQVCGNQFANLARKSKITYEGVTLTAWIGDQQLMRSANDMQFCFVNGRAMRDKLLLHAIRQAYEAVYEVIEQPAYVLFIDLNPNDVDVNVHPAKHEVRFQQARQVHDLVCKAFQDALSENFISNNNAPETEILAPKGFASHSPGHDYITPLKPSIPSSSNAVKSSTRSFAYVGEGRPSQQASAAYQSLMSDSNSVYKPIGNAGLLKVQHGSLYWVSAAECLKWWLQAQLTSSNIAQPLLMPVALACKKTWSERMLVEAHKLHFAIEFTHGKCILKKVPANLRTLPWGRLFPEIFNTMDNNESELVTYMSNVLAKQLGLLTNEVEQSFHWFNTLSSEQQNAKVGANVTQKTVADFVSWLQQ